MIFEGLAKLIEKIASKKITLLLCVLLSMHMIAQAQNSATIKIENAQKTEYVKNPDTGDEEIVLTGAVSISVTQGSTETKITASKITYSRSTKMLYASGNVTLLQTGGSEGAQNITAETLLFNTDTLEGIFDGGRVIQTSSDAINLPSGSSLIVDASIFGRDSTNTIVFKKADLTFCDEKDPHWKIHASKIWVLPGGEFAFFNAVLYIGHIPILYLPAFYYPKDELIFNPSFGYDKRRGHYFNTTTYLVGRKPLDTKSSSDSDSTSAALFNFLKATTLKKQKREGLVLHNLDEDETESNGSYLKVMGDYYTTLGGMIGIEGLMKPTEYISSLNGFFDVGFSRTIFPGGDDIYTPYSSSGEIHKDASNFMGLALPFRYAGNLAFSISKPFNFKLSFPIYSDPYFKGDFLERTEYMDWIGFLMSGAEEEKETSTNMVTSFSWDASASYNATISESMKPYITSLALSSISSTLVFSSKSATLTSSDNWRSYTPERLFYYPSQVTPIKLNGRISGTIFSYSDEDKKATKKSPAQFPIALDIPQYLKTEETDEKSAEEKKETSDGKKSEDEKSAEKEPLLPDDALPSLSESSKLKVQDIAGLKYDLTYSLSPQFTTQISYDASDLTVPEDFKWSKVQSTYYQIKAPLSISSSLSYRGTFFSMSNELSFSPSYQSHPNLSGYSDTSAQSIRKSDYNAFSMDLNESNKISFKPFIYTELLSDSSLTWNTNAKLIRTKFLGDMENPEWDFLPPDLSDDECITTHTLSANISAKESEDFSQTLTLSTTLPPQSDSYSAVLNLVFPYITTSFSSGIKKTDASDGSSTWTRDLLKQSATMTFFKGTQNALTFTESFNYNWEDYEADALKLSLSWKNLSLSYVMSTTYGYDFDDESGWSARSYKEFLPDNASLSYSISGKTFNWWNSKIALTAGLSTSVVYDCLRPTNSYFKFTPALTFKINDFLNLTFSSESRNSVIYRYFQGLTNSSIQIPGETNLFVDLFNSFAFWGDDTFFDPDQIKRKNSGFKLKNLKVTMTHSLCDWDLAASFSINPRLTTESGIRQYSFDPSMSFSIVWKPMSSMKVKVEDEYGEWTLNKN